MESKNCYVCEKQNLSKNEVGLNKKFIGRNVTRFYCLPCLAEYLDTTVEDLLAKVEDFKLQGCALFD
ncbi:hypothetical protein AGMMS50276_16390 [Synergistales bacterium]|nr:hypothetical protein AGMMS50276_16390 [Synergistales bacterium]